MGSCTLIHRSIPQRHEWPCTSRLSVCASPIGLTSFGKSFIAEKHREAMDPLMAVMMVFHPELLQQDLLQGISYCCTLRYASALTLRPHFPCCSQPRVLEQNHSFPVQHSPKEQSLLRDSHPLAWLRLSWNYSEGLGLSSSFTTVRPAPQSKAFPADSCFLPLTLHRCSPNKHLAPLILFYPLLLGGPQLTQRLWDTITWVGTVCYCGADMRSSKEYVMWDKIYLSSPFMVG